MPQSSPRHARAPRLARTRAKVALILTINASRTDLGDEGYQLTVNANGAQVVGANRSGLLWGARTIEQAVCTGQGTVPAGSITDIPRFADRGATLCACGTHITPDWITRQIDRMPDLKMNYLSLELRIKSDKYPVAQQFPFDRIDEYMEAFGSTEWHMGADEFVFKQGPGDFKKYLAQIRNHYGDQSMTFDAAFNDFINKVNAHVKSRGGTLRVWNDGIADISRIAVDKDVIIEYWGKGESSKKDANRGLPVKALVDAGYTVVNASSALYYYRDQPSSYVMQVKGLEGVYGTWTMNSFYQNNGYTVPDASIRGGKVSIWQGGHGKVTDHETEAWVTEGLRYGAQMFWNTKTPKADGNAEAFMVRIKALGEPSTYVDPTRDTLAPGQYTIALSDGRALSVSGGTPTAGTASDNWELAATPDGYYQIRSVNANRCLAVYSEEKPNSETHVSTTPGHPVTAYACADMSQEFTPTFQGDYATHTPQKWVAETAGDGFRLRNAMTNQYLSVIDSGYLSRRPNGGEKTVASEGLIGVCGPRIKAEAAAADSVETRWERGKESMATDGDPATYWHSQYIDANKAKLPGTDNARK